MDINYENNLSLLETNHLIKPGDILGFSCNSTAPISTSAASDWFSQPLSTVRRNKSLPKPMHESHFRRNPGMLSDQGNL